MVMISGKVLSYNLVNI